MAFPVPMPNSELLQYLAGVAEKDGMGSNNGARARRLIVVWDAPNMDMALGELLGRPPTAKLRPRFDRLAEWIARRGSERGLKPTATVFVNVSAKQEAAKRRFVQTVRSAGFGVFARPKSGANGDIDDAMLRHVREAVAAGNVAEVIIASHDRRAFSGLLKELTNSGLSTAVLGFREKSGWTDALKGVSFIDLESVEGCFSEPMHRFNLASLPPTGVLLPPNVEIASRNEGKPVETEPECPGVALILKALEDLARESGSGWILKSRLRPQLKRLDPVFTPESYGYPGFKAMLAACGDAVKTRRGTFDQELSLTGHRTLN